MRSCVLTRLRRPRGSVHDSVFASTHPGVPALRAVRTKTDASQEHRPPLHDRPPRRALNLRPGWTVGSNRVARGDWRAEYGDALAIESGSRRESAARESSVRGDRRRSLNVATTARNRNARRDAMSSQRLFIRLSAAVAQAALLLSCSRSSTSSAARGPTTPHHPATDVGPHVDPDVCAHLQGGPSGTGSAAADLGRAHALVRYFGVDGDPRMSDARLVDALDTNAPSTAAAVIEYGRRAVGTCVSLSEPSALGTAGVTLENEIAVVTPGAGDLPSIPTTAKAIAIDVRALPDTAEARDAVFRALTATLHGEVVLARTEERTCNGQPDEVNRFDGRNVEQYACKTHVREQRVAGRARGLPLAVLTASRLTPLAAWVAVTTRATVGALVVGDDVPTALAESRWIGIGNMGMAVRTGRLVADDGMPLPDIVRADYRSLDARAALRNVSWPSARPPLHGAADRPPIATSARPNDWTTPSNRVGDGRAAILTAYAATRTFFPYTNEIDDVLDARLDESLAIFEEGPTAKRSTVRKALRRFSEALHDGHAWVYDDQKIALLGGPVALLPIDDVLAVAVSGSPEAKPGDVVVSMGGTSTATWVREATKYASGSPHNVRAVVAERLVQAAVPIEIRRNGATQTITIPHGRKVSTTHGMFERKAGALSDLGAPDVYYLTLDASSPYGPNERDLPEIKAQIRGKRGVILDLRGYPSRAAWAVLAHVASPSSRGPKMADLVVTPWSREMGPFDPLQDLGMWTSEKQAYDGPVIVLTGARTQSQAEHWLSFFRSEKRGKVVGGQTSGANGTITGVQLPGGYGLTFTGMLVRHTDGSPFHAIGHVPDITVEPTLEDLQRGRDAVLLRALLELNREHPRALSSAK